MSDTMSKLNPQITKLDIGVRNLRTITIYPLSMSDQFSMDKIITEAMGAFDVNDSNMDLEIIGFIFSTIRDNLELVISLVTDKKEIGEGHILDDMTNLQMSNLIDIIYAVNYEEQIKNVQSLFKRIKDQFQSKRPLPQSVSDTEDIDLSTSIKDLSGKAD